MIEYIEVREKATRKLIGIVDTATSVIWKSVYYGVGEFEIYVSATPSNISILRKGNYVTRNDNDECGIIEHVENNDDETNGKMMTASGRFVKSLLDRRVVYSATLDGTGYEYIWRCSPTMLKGNVETAVRGLIRDNAVDCKFNPNRNMEEIELNDDDVSGIPDVISTSVDESDESSESQSSEKQVTYKSLLKYTDSVLQEYSCGARMYLDRDSLKFRYKVYKGEDRTRDSKTHQPIIFSKEFDNLTSMSYLVDDSASKTTALVGGEGEGTERGCALVYDWIKGIDRRETFVDASSITQGDLSVQEYRKQLESQGRQTISSLAETETLSGEIDMTNSNLRYGIDYNIGDMVTIEDKDLNKYINTRILAVTEVQDVQDEKGYNIDIEYGI